MKEKEKEKLKMSQRENVQYSAKLKTYRPAILKLLETFESMWVVHLRRIDVSKHRVAFLNDKARQ